MKKYKQFMESLPSKKVVISFGQFQPPTLIDEAISKVVLKISQTQKSDHIIFVSESSNKPLTFDRKQYYMEKIFPKAIFESIESRSLLEAVKSLSNRYTDLIVVTTSDKAEEIRESLNRNNHAKFNFSSINVISASESDNYVNKMKTAARKGLYENFKEGLPTSLTDIDGKLLMNEMRKGWDLDVIKEQVKFETSELREKYYAGEIFKLDEIVESDNIVYQIKKRGSNHLLLQNEQGKFINKWLQDVQYSNKEFNLLEGKLEEMKYSLSDKLKVAKVIGDALDVKNVDSMNDPEKIINAGLKSLQSKTLKPEYIAILNKMLKTAIEADIKFDKKLVPAKASIRETLKERLLRLAKESRDAKNADPKEKPEEVDDDLEDEPSAEDIIDKDGQGESMADKREMPQTKTMKARKLAGN